MSRKLWDYYNGEPFMENPHLVVVGNPKSTKGKKMARRKTRRKARRNAFPVAGIAVNPRRRRRSRVYHMRRRRSGVYAASNPRRRRSHGRRRGRRNPALLGVTLPPVSQILWGATGFIATPMVEGFLARFLPLEFTSSTLGRYAVKAGSVLGLTFAAKKVIGQSEAFTIALGGSAYVLTTAINEFLPQLTTTPAPVQQVTAYRTGMIKAYRNGMIGQYSRPGLAQARPGLAQGGVNSRFGLGPTGLLNPTQEDPRFAATVARS